MSKTLKPPDRISQSKNGTRRSHVDVVGAPGRADKREKPTSFLVVFRSLIAFLASLSRMMTCVIAERLRIFHRRASMPKRREITESGMAVQTLSGASVAQFAIDSIRRCPYFPAVYETCVVPVAFWLQYEEPSSVEHIEGFPHEAVVQLAEAIAESNPTASDLENWFEAEAYLKEFCDRLLTFAHDNAIPISECVEAKEWVVSATDYQRGHTMRRRVRDTKMSIVEQTPQSVPPTAATPKGEERMKPRMTPGLLMLCAVVATCIFAVVAFSGVNIPQALAILIAAIVAAAILGSMVWWIVVNSRRTTPGTRTGVTRTT